MSNYGKRGCKKKEREEQEKSPSASLRANPPAGNLVGSSGLEPPRYCYRQPLKLVRLPVPPRPHRGKDFIVAAPEKSGKARESSKQSNRSKLSYGLVGAAGAGCDGAGAEDCGTTGVGVTGAGAGTVLVAGFDTFSRTELPPTVPTPRSTLTTMFRPPTMNMIAHHLADWARLVS